MKKIKILLEGLNKYSNLLSVLVAMMGVYFALKIGEDQLVNRVHYDRIKKQMDEYTLLTKSKIIQIQQDYEFLSKLDTLIWNQLHDPNEFQEIYFSFTGRKDENLEPEMKTVWPDTVYLTPKNFFIEGLRNFDSVSYQYFNTLDQDFVNEFTKRELLEVYGAKKVEVIEQIPKILERLKDPSYTRDSLFHYFSSIARQSFTGYNSLSEFFLVGTLKEANKKGETIKLFQADLNHWTPKLTELSNEITQNTEYCQDALEILSQINDP